MKKVIIYTDGACSGNPGPGGWSAILRFGTAEKEMSGCEPSTTNNRMELLAVIMALKQLKEACIVDLFSDSAYIVNAIEKGWLDQWQKSDWRTLDKKPLKNADLWQQLYDLMQLHKVNFTHVLGHKDDEYNNKCDKLARGQVDEYLRTHKQN